MSMTFARDYTLRADRAPRLPAPAWPDATPAAAVPDTSRQPITAAERACLILACQRAYAAQPETMRPSGRTVKERQDAFRHEQVAHATEGRAHGLSLLMRADFRVVFARFLDLAGLTEKAFSLLMRTGRDAKGERHEDGEQSTRAVRAVLRKLEAHFAGQVRAAQPDAPPSAVREESARRLAAYVASIEAGKFDGAPWSAQPVKSQWHFYFTLRNRLAAMTGAGTPENRNKSQRRAPRADAHPF